MTTAPTNPITTVNGTQLTTAKSIPFANDDQVFYYVYTANTQKVTYTVIDETEQKTLEDKKPLVSGPSNSKLPNDTQAKYQDIIDGYMDKYELVGSDVLPAKFDSNDNVDQNVVIRLRHKQESVVENKTVTQTIQYVYADGSEAAPTKVAKLDFTRSNSKDLVTGQIVANGNWAPATNSFSEVASPNIAGFTPDKAKIDAVANVTADSNDINEKVIYTAKPKQKVLYTVIDDTEQKTLRDKEKLVEGDSDTDLPASATADYNNVVEFYKSKGYELVSQEALPNKFDVDASVDQVVTIHLKHGTESKEETKKVSLTVNYHGAGDKTPPSHVEEATWTRTVITDKVTGLVTDNGTWVANKEKYAEVTSPAIEGYTVDISIVAAETVTQENIVKDVNYSAKPVEPNKPGKDPNKPQQDSSKQKHNLPNTGVASSSLVTTIATLGILSGVVLLRRKKNFK